MRPGSFVLTLILLGALTISGCFFVSKSEVLKRVRSALPNVEITTDVFEVNSQCFLTSFDIRDELTAEQVLQSSALSSFRSLGKRWYEFASFDAMIEDPTAGVNPKIADAISYAVGAAKPCLTKAGLTFDAFYVEPIVVTYSKFGGSVLFFFKKDLSKAYYLVGD